MKSRGLLLLLAAVCVVGLIAVVLFALRAGTSGGGDAPDGVRPVMGAGPGSSATAAGPGAGQLVAPADVGAEAERDASGVEDPVDVAEGEVEIRVRVEAEETQAPVAAIRLFLVPADATTWSAPRVEGSRARLGGSPLTDEEGVATFVAPADTAYRLWAQGRETGGAETTVAGLRSGSRYEVVLRVPTRVDTLFHGRVVDASGGAPIAGAEVVVRASRRRRARGEWVWDGEPHAVLDTDADGRFRFTHGSWQKLFARVEAQGYGLALAEIGPGAGVPERAHVIELPRAGALELVVHDAESAPTPGLHVRLGTRFEHVLEAAGTVLRVTAPDPEWTATTDDEGRAVFEDLPPSVPLELEVRGPLHRGERPVLLRQPDAIVLGAGERRAHIVSLAGSTTVSGVLLDDAGSIIPRYEVWMSTAAAEGRAWFTRFQHPHARTLTDADGRFSFDDVPAGLWAFGPRPMTARGDERERARLLAPVATVVRVDATTGDIELELRAPRGLFLGGHVLGADDAPLAGASIWCVARDLPLELSINSGADGSFLLGPLVEGEYDLVAAPIGGDVITSAPVVANGGDRDVVLRCALGGTVSGRVVDANGRPAAAELFLAAGEAAPDAYVQGVTEDGAFRFAGRPPGEYAVVARTADGRSIGMATAIEVTAGEETSDVEVQLGPSATLEVHWKGPKGLWTVNVDLDGVPVAFDMIQGDTSVELVVPPGELIVLLNAPEAGRQETKTINARAGRAKTVTFE